MSFNPSSDLSIHTTMSPHYSQPWSIHNTFIHPLIPSRCWSPRIDCPSSPLTNHWMGHPLITWCVSPNPEPINVTFNRYRCQHWIPLVIDQHYPTIALTSPSHHSSNLDPALSPRSHQIWDRTCVFSFEVWHLQTFPVLKFNCSGCIGFKRSWISLLMTQIVTRSQLSHFWSSQGKAHSNLFLGGGNSPEK